MARPMFLRASTDMMAATPHSTPLAGGSLATDSALATGTPHADAPIGRAYIAAMIGTFLWSIHAVMIRKLIGEGLDPTLVCTLRLMLGTTFLAAFSLATPERLRAPKGVYANGYIWAIVVYAVNLLAFHHSLARATAGRVMLLEAGFPLVILLYLVLFERSRLGDRTSQPGYWGRLTGVVALGTIGGACVILAKPASASATGTDWGMILAVGAMFSWAAYNLILDQYVRAIGERGAAPQVTLRLMFGTMVLVAPFAHWGQLATITPRQWSWFLLLGCGSTGMANLCWNYATHRLNNVVVMTLFFMLTLVATALLEWAWLGVRPTLLLTVGAVLVLYAAWSSRRLR